MEINLSGQADAPPRSGGLCRPSIAKIDQPSGAVYTISNAPGAKSLSRSISEIYKLFR